MNALVKTNEERKSRELIFEFVDEKYGDKELKDLMLEAKCFLEKQYVELSIMGAFQELTKGLEMGMRDANL